MLNFTEFCTNCSYHVFKIGTTYLSSRNGFILLCLATTTMSVIKYIKSKWPKTFSCGIPLFIFNVDETTPYYCYIHWERFHRFALNHFNIIKSNSRTFPINLCIHDLKSSFKIQKENVTLISFSSKTPFRTYLQKHAVFYNSKIDCRIVFDLFQTEIWLILMFEAALYIIYPGLQLCKAT